MGIDDENPESSVRDESYTISSRQHYELIQAQNNVCELVLRLSDLLSDPSRFASYPTAPGLQPQRSDTQSAGSRRLDQVRVKGFPDISRYSFDRRDTVSDPQMFDTRLTLPERLNLESLGYVLNPSSLDRRKSRESVNIEEKHLSFTRKPLVFTATSRRTYKLENARARRRYAEQRKQSNRLYARASLVAADYDFQYKFYSDLAFARLERESSQESLGFDALYWSLAVPQPSDIDAYNAFHQLDHGRRLQEAVQQRLPELMDALFPFKTRHVLQSLSWPELEYSYGLYLRRVIETAGLGQCASYLGYFDSDVTQLLIEIGRFFNEIDFSNRPSGYQRGMVPDAVGPYMNGEWPTEIRKEYTLQELHRRCQEKGLLRDWEDMPIRRVLVTRLPTILIAQDQSEMVYIMEVILFTSKGISKDWELHSPPTTQQSQEFILDYLQQFCHDETHEHLEQSTDRVFAAPLFHVDSLRRLGDLSIIWTDNIDDHLRLSLTSRTLQVFWDVSLLEQSLLFWCNSQVLKKNLMQWSEITKRPQSHVFYELKCTYRLLFADHSSSRYTFTETTRKRRTPAQLGIRVNDIRIDPNHRRAQHVLRHLLDTPLPPQLQNARIPGTPSPKQSFPSKLLSLLSLLRPTKKPPTIRTFLSQGPPYPLDLCWHIENILTPFPCYAGESNDMRDFASFQRFGDRLREIAFYMDNQKPKGWSQMWKDRRDRVQHVTFWAVLVFGSVSVVLALVGIAVGSAQTVAAFRALGRRNR